ncbi:hypothetical protein [Sphingobacterium spiritivorum]|uniref:hypothetical protein n=1 Tax=Sphingobacterium spiritivorum TaxID=258 RepID=UPI001917D21B|nr:hypothetical protein [Sphingobacterium spiritivorum]QQT25289.1 hypothetical protein I6J02_16395 [Sphingobacterium spiritivorum]
MSRSLRKTKIFGITTAETEKQDKRRWNRTFRKVCKKLIRLEKEVPSKIQGVTSVWDGAKDGKKYYCGATQKDMRKIIFMYIFIITTSAYTSTTNSFS